MCNKILLKLNELYELKVLGCHLIMQALFFKTSPAKEKSRTCRVTAGLNFSIRSFYNWHFDSKSFLSFSVS